MTPRHDLADIVTLYNAGFHLVPLERDFKGKVKKPVSWLKEWQLTPVTPDQLAAAGHCGPDQREGLGIGAMSGSSGIFWLDLDFGKPDDLLSLATPLVYYNSSSPEGFHFAYRMSHRTARDYRNGDERDGKWAEGDCGGDIKGLTGQAALWNSRGLALSLSRRGGVLDDWVLLTLRDQFKRPPNSVTISGNKRVPSGIGDFPSLVRSLSLDPDDPKQCAQALQSISRPGNRHNIFIKAAWWLAFNGFRFSSPERELLRATADALNPEDEQANYLADLTADKNLHSRGVHTPQRYRRPRRRFRRSR